MLRFHAPPCHAQRAAPASGPGGRDGTVARLRRRQLSEASDARMPDDGTVGFGLSLSSPVDARSVYSGEGVGLRARNAPCVSAG